MAEHFVRGNFHREFYSIYLIHEGERFLFGRMIFIGACVFVSEFKVALMYLNQWEIGKTQ